MEWHETIAQHQLIIKKDVFSNWFSIIFIHHKMVAIMYTNRKQSTNKQSLTKESNYLRYCDNFLKNKMFD